MGDGGLQDAREPGDAEVATGHRLVELDGADAVRGRPASRSPLRAPAACRWARVTVKSTVTSRVIRPCASAPVRTRVRMRFQVLLSEERPAQPHRPSLENQPPQRTRPARRPYSGMTRPRARSCGRQTFRQASTEAASVRTSRSSWKGRPFATKVHGRTPSRMRSASALNSTVTPCSASASMTRTTSTNVPPARSNGRATLHGTNATDLTAQQREVSRTAGLHLDGQGTRSLRQRPGRRPRPHRTGL